MVFDVWTSQKAFDKFAKTLMPILQEIGLDSGQPTVMDIHEVIVPAPKSRRARSGQRPPRRAGASAKDWRLSGMPMGR